LANITVEASSNIQIANRVSVRTSGDRVYVLATSGTSLEMHKGNVNGRPASFDTPVAITSITGLFDSGACCAIDSNDDIHCLYYQIDPDMAGIQAARYVIYDTGTDTFGTPETIAVLDNDPTYTKLLGLCLDANDDPHVFWRDANKDMGVTTISNYYANKISGWSTRLQFSSDLNDDIYPFDIMIADPLSSVNADRPIIVEIDQNPDDMDIYHGNALNATGFTKANNITGAISPSPFTTPVSMTIDSNEKIVIAFIENGSLDLMIVEHLNSAAWGTWVTPITVNSSVNNFEPSLAINGTDLYVFSVNTATNDLRLFEDTGSGFNEVTGEQDLPNVGTFNSQKAKWSSKNLNSPTKIDYVFKDSGGTVLYNEFDTAFVPPSAGDEPEYASIVD